MKIFAQLPLYCRNIIIIFSGINFAFLPTTLLPWGLIAQLVEHHTGDMRLWVRFPLKSWDFLLGKRYWDLYTSATVNAVKVAISSEYIIISTGQKIHVIKSLPMRVDGGIFSWWRFARIWHTQGYFMNLLITSCRNIRNSQSLDSCNQNLMTVSFIIASALMWLQKANWYQNQCGGTSNYRPIHNSLLKAGHGNGFSDNLKLKVRSAHFKCARAGRDAVLTLMFMYQLLMIKIAWWCDISWHEKYINS